MNINERPDKSIQILLHIYYILIKVYDLVEILNLILYAWVYCPYCYLSLN